jgi:hypothetical protein
MEPQTHHRISGIYVTFLNLKTLVHIIGQPSGKKSGNQMPDSTRTISTAIPCTKYSSHSVSLPPGDRRETPYANRICSGFSSGSSSSGT